MGKMMLLYTLLKGAVSDLNPIHCFSLQYAFGSRWIRILLPWTAMNNRLINSPSNENCVTITKWFDSKYHQKSVSWNIYSVNVHSFREASVNINSHACTATHPDVLDWDLNPHLTPPKNCHCICSWPQTGGESVRLSRDFYFLINNMPINNWRQAQ